MREVQLKVIPHDVKIGQICGRKEPNCTEDTLFLDGDKIVGFYIRKLPEDICKIADIADEELNSPRVPKTEMRRASGMRDPSKEVRQFSTIIGAVPPNPFKRRPYPGLSGVHYVPTAKTFVSAMLNLCTKVEELIRSISTEMFETQQRLIEENVPEQFRFGRLFTSSISNFNIAAPYHRDAGNLQGCVNAIVAKKRGAIGGHTTVPDYDLTVNSADNSLLVYPAWRNIHAVTPIEPVRPGGYRNSLVFYPLKAFKKYLAPSLKP